MTSLPAPPQLSDVETQIAHLLVQRDDLIQEHQLSPRREPSRFHIEDLPTVAESEARIRDGVRKIRARSGAAKVARAEADRIEALRQAKKKEGK